MQRTLPKLIVISGASGSGKTTLLNFLYEKYGDKLRGLPNVTTRAKRDNDEAFLEHVSKEEFLKMKEENVFPWTKEIHGNLYGLRSSRLRDAFTKDWSSAMIITPDTHPILAAFVESIGRSLDEVCFIHILSPEEAVLRGRLRVRGDDQESIERRILECTEWDFYTTQLNLPIHLVSNTGSIEALEETVIRLIEKGT